MSNPDLGTIQKRAIIIFAIVEAAVMAAGVVLKLLHS
jgi:hypothetical protein